MLELTRDQIVERTCAVIGLHRLPAPLHVPEIGPTAWTYVKDCLDTNWVSSVGSYVNRFEEQVAEFTGARFAIATVNGTAALHVALQLCGVERDQEVLMPSLTFIATANAVSYLGAIPHFVDVRESHLGIDADRIRDYLRQTLILKSGASFNRKSGRRVAALVGMHAFGHPFDIQPVQDVCEEFQLAFVEDSAEGLGSYAGGRHVGTFGRLGVLSFNGNKTITTGGGGMILANDEELAKRAKHLTTTGKQPHAWEFFHDQVAYNYRLPNLNAALGCSQMEDLPRLLAAKRKLAEDYIDAFAGTQIRIVTEPPGCRSNYWLNALIPNRGGLTERNELLEALHQAGIMARPVWNPMHTLPMYADCPRMPLDVTEQIAARLINVPSSSTLRREAETT